VRGLIEPKLGPDDEDQTCQIVSPLFYSPVQNVSGWKTMLSLTLRVLWFTFAILGVPATWLVFIPYASAIGTYWAPVLYCVTVTVLEVVFSIGMIWRMNPFHMPHWFCIVQTVIIGLCFHILTGICVCFTWASYLTVFKPYRSIQASAS